jgi:hypothetical protein
LCVNGRVGNVILEGGTDGGVDYEDVAWLGGGSGGRSLVAYRVPGSRGVSQRRQHLQLSTSAVLRNPEAGREEL